MTYPKRLIEVDLPIRRISHASRSEKSARHGNLSTLHVWWARRPLAACRAVIAASLWIDPDDPNASPAYLSAIARTLREFAEAALMDRDTRPLLGETDQFWAGVARTPADTLAGEPLKLRTALLEVVALSSAWQAASNRLVLGVLETLTLASHASLSPVSPRPWVIDPFAGGGAMPLEALRVGADAFASDLNPLAVLLNRVSLEYAPGQQQGFASEVRQLGADVARRVSAQVADLYPADASGTKPIAYLWARTVRCEGPACGKPIALARTFWLTQRAGGVGVKMHTPASATEPTFEVLVKPRTDQVSRPTVQRGAALCPWCTHVTPVEQVRAQLSKDRGGADTATLMAVVVENANGARSYRAPTPQDLSGVARARERLARLRESHPDLLPDEALPPKGALGFRVQNYGITRFDHLHSARQLVTLATIAQTLRALEAEGVAEPLCATLSLALGRLQDLNSSLCTWADTVVGANRAQNRVSMVWDFAEAAPFAGAGGSWEGQVDWIVRVLEHIGSTVPRAATVVQAPAQTHPLPDDAAALLATDPPYYDAFGYADLSDLFFVWLKRSTARPHERFAQFGLDGKTPKELEIIVNPEVTREGVPRKDHDWFYEQMRQAFAEARRVVEPSGIGVIVFAHKDTKSWEALLTGVIDAGWIVTASWPIDTERPTRQRALGAAALASSVHLVCRPREDQAGELQVDAIGSWSAVLAELPVRLHQWLPRLAEEGVVGADAIFACLGPALEIFSRYSEVQKVSGDIVKLPEYLEHVWASVSREALSMLFSGAQTEGLEADARVTAVWLWTLAAPTSAGELGAEDDAAGESERAEEDATAGGSAGSNAGFILDFDAARKIAQGLGAQIAELSHLIEVKGNKARLLSVTERVTYLFGAREAVPTAKKAAKKKQMTLFAELDEVAEHQGWGAIGAPSPGHTTLDRVHQAMVLFAAGRDEAMKRFLLQDGVGQQSTFWRLAQALSFLYPVGAEEKRWIDGVLARKKGLGFG
ncbi:DUF1156 domain-containing protein [Steroidobacter sp. S1-65]|uniref:DUF1156 domain-containing protein n=1 Tax=Steroidobacter gossypii TaxID=2805490 RepID=A0ABS1WZW9_9GAMM|nr:DUF1156 domain-containing protein [Steroidobacter gossypii]MBM0106503.1 DUF1156 domain-containing protein [Steroidobacter gossypii]